MKFLFAILLTIGLGLSTDIQAQSDSDTEYVYVRKLPAAEVVGEMDFDDEVAAYKYRQYQHYIKIVWPYVLEGSALLNEIDKKMKSNASPAEKRRFIKSKEKEFKEKFEDPIKDLNINQGKILIKLMNRQIGSPRTIYSVVKAYKGGAIATKWKLWAKLNGMDISEVYDPLKEPRMEGMLRRLGYAGVQYQYF